MADFWGLQEVAWWELAKGIARKSWNDEVFGESARLAFYYFLSLFPMLLLLLILLDKFAGARSTAEGFRYTLLHAFQQTLPAGASALMAKTVDQLNAGAVIGLGSVAAALASVWGALNGTWAMMAGLNTAYEVKEDRRLWKILSVAFGLTICLGAMGVAALAAILYGSRAWEVIAQDSGVHTQAPFLWRLVEWLMTATLLLFSATLMYRFGPNVKVRKWRWSIPGAVVAVTLWIVSTVLLRIYQNHFGSERIYGSLNAVVTLLMWLYLTGAAIFIGGETNSAIEKAARTARRGDVGIGGS